MSVISDLHKKGIDKDSLKAKIKDIAIKTVIAIQPFLINTFHVEMGVGNVNTNVFHIFGIDILVDQSGKPWLLEINASPSLNMYVQSYVNEEEDEEVKSEKVMSKLDKDIKT